eukprot:Sspe_Gene.91034::Locus_62520_Transcript_2_2_Confidence_0.286_Length_1224::g.91034::m.91034
MTRCGRWLRPPHRVLFVLLPGAAAKLAEGGAELQAVANLALYVDSLGDGVTRVAFALAQQSGATTLQWAAGWNAEPTTGTVEDYVRMIKKLLEEDTLEPIVYEGDPFVTAITQNFRTESRLWSKGEVDPEFRGQVIGVQCQGDDEKQLSRNATLRSLETAFRAPSRDVRLVSKLVVKMCTVRLSPGAEGVTVTPQNHGVAPTAEFSDDTVVVSPEKVAAVVGTQWNSCEVRVILPLRQKKGGDAAGTTKMPVDLLVACPLADVAHTFPLESPLPLEWCQGKAATLPPGAVPIPAVLRERTKITASLTEYTKKGKMAVLRHASSPSPTHVVHGTSRLYISSLLEQPLPSSVPISVPTESISNPSTKVTHYKPPNPAAVRWAAPDLTNVQ